MTGNAPQPGKTPAGEPWGAADPPDGWWRGETDREPTSLEWADRAREAGADDATQRLTAPGQGERLATAGELMIVEPGRPGPADDVPEMAILPEPDDRNRPTIVLDQQRPPRGPLPPLPEGGVSPATATRLDRMENSPFWQTDEARIVAEARNDPRPGKRRRPPATHPVGALTALLGLSLLAAFFAWVSAEPFWLAVGHGDPGYATTTHCHGDGLTQHCTGRFASADGRIAVRRVTLLGISGGAREPGAVARARMVNRDSGQAYAGPPGMLLHLRWALGFLLVLICGYGIAGATGARRLESPRARRGALLASVLGPVLLLAGFLAAAY
ncbi:hypothetical protein ACWT_7668 [Actinoplanes sp. SE50]|uniref:hypothetical protein n=1 Tax=unclassified Actinoplanes TaxID=2626549 RepID=UPI00023EDE01|nr:MULTISPECIES: hypothetical protein [unclassified Actinoplanes]AEV88679.1 hypothetical protein ACPL_7799 [Actinoplanes sp. SE50/110]ATO87083.1 hypothetical protein ACWT_7668 [Actinoplanes sp. SE50]SLM04501.1 hypothetical protein ACSP50_7807 [Actinoplanes sp. SE50/110]